MLTENDILNKTIGKYTSEQFQFQIGGPFHL